MFRAPQFLRMPAVGLDISDDAIRFMELVPDGEYLRVGNYATETYTSAGADRDRKKLKDAITAFASAHKLSYANVSLPEEEAYLANMRIPRVPPKEIRGAIELKMEEHVPIAPAAAIFDFVEVGNDAAHHGDFMDVVVCVLPRSVVDDYLSLFEGTGIVPRSFEFESHATARAVIPVGDHATTLVVDIGNMQTGVFVAAHGIVEFSALLDIGGHFFTQAIAKELGCTPEEAEAKKIEKGLIGEADDPVIAAMTPLMSDLKMRLLRHYAYWQSHQGEKFGGNIENVLLCGGGANMRGLAEFLATGLDVRVAVANPWVNVAQFNRRVPTIPYRKSLSYATAIGLALRSSHRSLRI